MRTHLFYSWLIAFCITSIFLSAQVQEGRIILMNGSVAENVFWEEKDGMILIYNQKKSIIGKTKKQVTELNKSEIFSLNSGAKEKILYYQDTMLGDYYTPEEMRMYLSGANDARKNYKARHVSAIGFVICAAAGYAVGDGLLILILPPVAFAASQVIGKIKIREKYISDKNFKYNDLYAEGFEPPARSRKIIRSALSGLAGSISGVALSLIKNQ